MLNFVVAAGLENVDKADEIAVDVGVRVGDGVTDSRLSSEVDNPLGLGFCEEFVD